jgi:hypothetical protein
VKIEDFGRAISTIDLQRQGFAWKQKMSIPGSTDIEFTRGSGGRLVQVRTAVYPREPLGLSEDETQGIKSRASQIGYEPWLAQITLKTIGSAAKPIIWAEVE